MRNGGGFSIEALDLKPAFISLRISGKGAYEAFKDESGGHRWQRVPPTEKKGRVHSSTITVAVIPEIEPRKISLNLNDVDIETYRSSGPGGQHRNKTDSAVRATHKPTGITACATAKSQHQNKATALAVLASRIADKAKVKETKSANQKRRKQIGSGMRADKIRTVAEQRGRVENHLNGRRMKIGPYLRGELDKIL